MIKIVNMIPASLSAEAMQDSEPNLAVDPVHPMNIVATAFTPAPMGGANAPIYVSTDGGSTWSLQTIVPGNGAHGTSDITVGFASAGGVLYAGTLNGVTGRLNILRTASFISAATMSVLVDRASEDQPWVVAGSVMAGASSQDRVYVGNNNLGKAPGATATVDFSTDAASAPAPAGFSPHLVEQRPTSGQDGPPTRIALHPSGVVYAAFQRWTNNAPYVRFDVVVVRDDNWGSSATPFSALKDSGDGAVGQRVVSGQFAHFNDIMGQERLGADLAIAVDPVEPRTVWIAWCDRVGGNSGTDWTMHVRRSTDGGQTWSSDLRTITNTKNPGLAVNAARRLGLAYQAYTGTRWETHLELTEDGWISPVTDILLHSAPATTPTYTFRPYIGDYIRLLAVENDFYGVFCGNNTPDTANFPNGVSYQRRANWTTHTLLSTYNTPVAPSIDPFFFHWIEPAPQAVKGGDIALVAQAPAPGVGTIPVAFAGSGGSWTITDEQATPFVGDWASQPGVRMLTGDYDRNHRTDIALVRQTPGWSTIPVAFATGNGHWKITDEPAPSFIDDWACQPGVRAIAGDFSGDGRTDIVLVRQTPGWSTIPVAFATGNGQWKITNGPVPSFIDNWACQPGVRVIVGDFDGDGRTDIALVRQTPGWDMIPIAFSKGDGSWRVTSQKVSSGFADWACQPGVRVIAGDFDGNGRTDIALVRQTPGWDTIPIAFSNRDGSWRVTNQQAPSFIADWACRPGTRVLTGDFNDNGRTDIALVCQTIGCSTIPIAFSSGDGSWLVTNGQAPQFMGDWACQPGVRVLTGDFNDNGRTDIALVRQLPGWNTIPIAFSNGHGEWQVTNGQAPSFIADWACRPGTEALIGEF
jgi:FG-GAP-like repeat